MQTDQAITRFNLGDREFCFYLPDLDDPLQQTIRETRAFHELDMLADMILRIAPGDLIVDCGANIGNHTVFLAKAAEATVIAVEPSKHCFEILDRNIALNDLDNRVLAVPLACGAKNETGTIIPGPQGYPSQARVAANVRGMGAEVKITPLDELQLPAPVRMLRIDMLGMEADILRGVHCLFHDSTSRQGLFFLWILCLFQVPLFPGH